MTDVSDVNQQILEDRDKSAPSTTVTLTEPEILETSVRTECLMSSRVAEKESMSW